MGYDHYKNAFEIADKLEQIGQKEYATKIRDAINDHFSGTQIFMILRSELVGIQNADLDVGEAVKLQMKELRYELEKALS